MKTDISTNREHLTTQVYGTEDALAVRIRTHELYTRPEMDFTAWVLDHVPWRGDEVVLDIGCGAGAYIEPVLARLTAGGRLLSGDLSMGMLRDVAAKPLPAGVSLLCADAMHLPLPDGCCDLVLANHMLYHVPQIERAVAEARRVLRSGGYFVAATNARNSMQGFEDQVVAAVEALGYPVELPGSPVRTRFNLGNGKALIESHFPTVQVDRFEAALVFPAAGPVVAYINTLSSLTPFLPETLSWAALMEQVERQIARQVAECGEYRVSKVTGVFLAQSTVV